MFTRIEVHLQGVDLTTIRTEYSEDDEAKVKTGVITKQIKVFKIQKEIITFSVEGQMEEEKDKMLKIALFRICHQKICYQEWLAIQMKAKYS